MYQVPTGRNNPYMVRHVHATLNDDDFEVVDETKDELRLAWGEYIMEATKLLREEHDLD